MSYDYNSNKSDIISWNRGDKDLTLVYIVLTNSNSLMSKTIGKFTGSIYNHASISFDLNLDRMFSFGFSEKDMTPGFAIEDIDTTFMNNKLRFNRSTMGCQVYAVAVTEKQSTKMRFKINEYLSLKHKMKYNFTGLFGYLLNKPMTRDNKMVCSEFVDSLLKFSDIDLTKKNSALVRPVDFANVDIDSVKLIYEGYLSDYKSNSVQRKADKFLSEYKKGDYTSHLNESEDLIGKCQQCGLKRLFSDDGTPCDCGFDHIIGLNEAKQFPVQFDGEGNLIIKNFKMLNYEKEYSNSHKLLLVYDKQNNYQGMMYEMSKLWFINNVIENKLFNSKLPDDRKKELLKTRARILNDFNKYLKVITKDYDRKFNFTEYYNTTPFSDVYIKIDKNTLVGLTKLIKASIL